MTENEKQALRGLLLDIDCLSRLDKWTDEFNLFDVLKITNVEIRHSNILAWLLDPNENHGMGDRFIRQLLTTIVSKTDYEKYNVFQILLQNFYSYQVYRESNHMDIVLHSYEEKTAVIIENKIWSRESSHQLKDYVEKSKVTYKDCNQVIYVFLTPGGRDSSDPENWISLSYEEVLSALYDAKSDIILRPEVDLIIKNYMSTIRRNIMKEKDEELVQICNEIYNKHREAFRLIFDNVEGVNNSVESEIICNTLKELCEEGVILYGSENKWYFFTQQMNDYLPELPENNSSWGTKWIYYYWFESREDKLIIHFEIGGNNLPKDARERQKKLIRASKKSEKEGYTYCRLFRAEKILKQDDYEENLKKAVKYLVKTVLENEKKLFGEIEKE